MKKEQLKLFRQLLTWRILDDDITLEAVIDIVDERDAAWSAYWKAYARLDYEENEGRDPDAELVARQAHNVARDALVVMGVDPELLG